jgi:hypothetical protein
VRFDTGFGGAGKGAVDGRSCKPTALDPFETVVHTVLERLEDVRITGEGRPAQVRQSMNSCVGITASRAATRA